MKRLTDIQLAIAIGILAGALVLAIIFSRFAKEEEMVSPLPADFVVRAYEIRDSSPTPTPKPELEVLAVGKVSYYSHAGCLGCGEKQITASGQPFDENAMTLAIPAEWRKKIKMGTKVLVTNMETGVSVEATVNDTGGFLKYNRIADLSKGLYQKLGAKTDKTTIKIERLEK